MASHKSIKKSMVPVTTNHHIPIVVGLYPIPCSSHHQPEMGWSFPAAVCHLGSDSACLYWVTAWLRARSFQPKAQDVVDLSVAFQTISSSFPTLTMFDLRNKSNMCYLYIYIYEPGPRTPTPPPPPPMVSPPPLLTPPPPQNLVFACYLHIYIHIYTPLSTPPPSHLYVICSTWEPRPRQRTLSTCIFLS